MLLLTRVIFLISLTQKILLKLFNTFSARENESTEILYKQLLPRDATIEKNPFIIRNFIVGNPKCIKFLNKFYNN